jgi:hypothetical protein
MTMRRSLMLCSVLAVLFIIGVGVLSPWHGNAYAQTPPPSGSNPPGTPASDELKTINNTKCSELPEAEGGKLLGKIVPCMTYTIESSTVTFAAKMVATLRPLFYAFLTLVVVLFGARMLSQEPEIGKQGFLLLVKIAIVGIILADLGNTQAYDGSGSQGKLIPAVYDIMNESQAIVAGAINITGLKCDMANFQGPKTPKVWAMMDCVLGKLYGFTTGTDPNTGKESTNMLLVASFFGLMSGFFFGGAWGVTIFLGMLGVLFTIFMLVVRMAVGFITSYLVICLMLIMTPLLLPLALLKVTASYFDQYWRIILSGFLTPVIITAYSMFALILYDKVLFDEKAPIQKLFKYENIKEALQPGRAACSRQVASNPYEMRFSDTEPTAASIAKKFTNPFLQNNVQPTLTGANDPCAATGFKIHPIDDTKIKGIIESKGGPSATATGEKAENDRRALFQSMFEQLLSLFVIAYLIYKGLESLTTIISQITGKRSASVAGEAVLGQNLDLQQRGKEIYANAISKFRVSDDKNVGATYKSGSEFLTGLPSATSEIVKDSLSILAKGKRSGE